MRVVQQLSEARDALQAGAHQLQTPKGSGIIAGVGYWHAVQETLRSEFQKTPFTLWVCCANNAGVAHDAMRLGLNIMCDVSEDMRAKLQAIAQMQGVKILDKTTG